MKSHEHRAVGEAATAGARVGIGGDAADQRLVLGYGDVVALSGDFFPSHHSAADDLFRLAAIPGMAATGLECRAAVYAGRPSTRQSGQLPVPRTKHTEPRP